MRCDSHVHIVEPISKHPQIDGRTFLAEPAPLDVLKSNGAARGIDHFVITQPSFYGTDNTVLLGALDQLEGRGSGVAVVDPLKPAPDLKSYRERGVSGLRVNIYSPAAQNVGGGSDDLEAVTTLAADANLHVEIIAPLRLLLEKANFIESSGVTTVIDHYGLYGDCRPDSSEGQRLLSMLGCPHVWIKLSSPYRNPSRPLNIDPDREWLELLIAVAPDRCVWGSDWPHPPAHDAHLGPEVSVPWRSISYSDLFDRFAAAVGMTDVLDRILWRNPARLYQFSHAC